jgi:hypothetical protein
MNPPPKGSPPTKENVQALSDWLTSILAFHADSSDRPWFFYEEIDRYLGPWGATGYPIAYGKKYCQLFYNDSVLQDNPAAEEWVERTLLLLQEELRAFILARYTHGKLATLTERELRDAAFASHPKAYTKGGLTMVVLLQPRLAAEIASIPFAEFRPTAPSFGSSVRQVIDTTGVVITEAIGNLLAAAAGPAHNQSFRLSSARDFVKYQTAIAVSQEIADIRQVVRVGSCDHVDVLTRLKKGVELTLFEGRGTSVVAGLLVREIDARIALVKARYARESGLDPRLGSVYRQFDPATCGVRPN